MLEVDFDKIFTIGLVDGLAYTAGRRAATAQNKIFDTSERSVYGYSVTPVLRVGL